MLMNGNGPDEEGVAWFVSLILSKTVVRIWHMLQSLWNKTVQPKA